jgi:concentrative nucleoside transporter, CNT family
LSGVARALLGITVLILVAVLLSENRRAIRPRVVLSALATQVAIGSLVLFVPWGRAALAGAATGVNRVIAYGNAGVSFLFGSLVSDRMHELFGDTGFVFALRVLPAIIYVSALIAVLYHTGVMRWVITVLGLAFQKLLGVSPLESFAAVSTIFVGQSEMPAVLKPLAGHLRGPQLFAVMTSGMAAVAGSTLAGYVGLGVPLEYLLAASIMAVPGGLLFAKLICPGGGDSEALQLEHLSIEERPASNVIEAASSGALLGLKVALNVGAMLIAFIGLIALLDGIVGTLTAAAGLKGVSLQTLLGWLFAPLAWLLGVTWKDAGIAGNLIAQKLILNEFVGYVALAPYLAHRAVQGAAALPTLDAKTIVVVSFALCGFANFSSIAILTGGFRAVAERLGPEVARYGLRAVAAASLSNFASATIAGCLLAPGR